jgi:osmotically-inducible protein OsmY
LKGEKNQERKEHIMPVSVTSTRGDKSIREDVVSELQWDPKITSPDIGIVVKDGVVALSGYVGSYWEKDSVEKAAKRVYGVKGVANDLEVTPYSKRTDPEIARDAVHALQSHAGVPDEKITVTVKNGWVTLEGTVDWQYQRNAADSAVRKLNGVVSLINNLQVKPRVSPSEIETKIQDALKRSAEVDARRITVTTDDGVLVLSGHVRSWREKDEAERAAWSAPGVTRVDNRITITP